MLKVILALFIVSVVYSAYVEVDNSGNNFRISLNPASEVRWTKNGKNYRHLQELARYCTVPGTPVALGGIGNWQCGPYDTLANLNCTGSFGSLFNPVVKEINGVFQCAAEQDTLAYLAPVCAAGQTVKFTPAGWVCALDADTFRDLQGACPATYTLIYDGSSFVCANSTFYTSTDVLSQSLLCGNNQIVRFNAATKQFVCDDDHNTIPANCADGQLVAFTSAGWVCVPDSDVLSLGIPTCSQSTPFLKYRNGAWVCVASYYILNIIGSPGFLTYLQTANVFQQQATPQSLTVYTILWGSINQQTLFSTAPPVFPFNGTITSTYLLFQGWTATQPNTVVKVDFSVSGTVVFSPTFSVPQGGPTEFPFLTTPGSSQPFTAGQAVSITLSVISGNLQTTPPALSTIYVAVYVSVNI